jgi:hypothetical protein
MKQTSLILSMIIPGPKSPENDIDVYLQPLIDVLLELWEGVQTFDASSKEYFKLKAALMWTINDFPALAYLSGWTTSGRYACPSCGPATRSFHLKKLRCAIWAIVDGCQQIIDTGGKRSNLMARSIWNLHLKLRMALLFWKC